MNLKQSWQVGAFVIAGLVLFITSLFLLGSGSLFQKHKTYKIEFDHVQGLNPGAVVSLAGLNIGNVSNISFGTENKKIQIEIKVEEELSQRITVSTRADLRTQGALGDKYIYLSPGDTSEAPLADKSKIEVLETKDILAVLADRGGEAEKVFDILKNVNEIAKSVNSEKRIEKILENLVVASQDFRVASANISKLTSNPKLNQSVERVDLILSKIERGEGSLGALINDSSLHDSLKALVGAGKNQAPFKNVLRNTIKENK